MLIKLFLGLQAIIFIPYGLYCLVDPELLIDGAGVMATSGTGTIELQAMYGGLQTAVGVLCALAIFRDSLRPVALTALLFIFAGLATVRVSLGLTQGDFSSYNVFAMAFESSSLLFLIWHHLRQPAA
jgi:hypothetical protein